MSDESEGDNDEIIRNQQHLVPVQYATLGGPYVKCNHCDAFMWKEERANKSVTRGTPVFSICCKKGQIRLPENPNTPSFLWQLYNDPKKGKHFKKCSKIYNAMFAFTSTGGKVDHSVNNGRGPYVYRLNGQNHHVFGSLISNEGKTPKFCQLYIYDTDNEISNRMQWIDLNDGDKIDQEIVRGLLKMFDENNELVKRFRIARDRFKESGIVDLEIILKVCRSQSGRENNIGPSDEVAGIMVGEQEETEECRDIIIQAKAGGFQRVTNVHPKLMALQYPILFPTGEDGYHKDIYYAETEENKGKTRHMCSMKDFYSYRLHIRHNQGMSARLGGRLFQQYVVDAFSTIEQARLWWFRTHQTTIRNELYINICDVLREGDCDSENIGKSVILPARFVGSKRYMQQNFQDALAVCRYVGHPDIFLTMTCNPTCDEILEMMKLIPNCSPHDSPDIIARVFHLKLQQLVDDVKKKSYFGTCLGVMYVIEFQKRGLPHVHMLIWLDSASKQRLKQNVDSYVSAEIPDPLLDPVGYAAVNAFMMHGPCGPDNMKSPCMKDFKCSHHFPKKFCSRTMFDECGFPIYKRRKTDITVKVRNSELDNRYVVPYNRDLLVKYQCHMNVEICCHARSLKYLFKYCLKGHDRATVEVRSKGRKCNAESSQTVDEIQCFFMAVTYAQQKLLIGFLVLKSIIDQFLLKGFLIIFLVPKIVRSVLMSLFIESYNVKRQERDIFFSNSSDPNARKYTYDQIPKYYVWNGQQGFWSVRKRGLHIGRLTYTHHSTGELWYLRMLLTKVPGPMSYKELLTVNNIVHSSFQEACSALDLLDDDKEWNEVIEDCSKCGFPPQIRQLFVHIIMNCQVGDLKSLWITHAKAMSDDILYAQRKLKKNPTLILDEEQVQYLALGV
ncbi:uncharacterized protein LOC141714035 [Apium graveolens]|uniref:uncharacterized protein LOC141714035 n=1 Tax=Apium graveolens TaxID=4045 RepID=UPI003D7A42BB